MRSVMTMAWAALLTTATGCYKNTLQAGIPGAGTQDETAQFFLWGLVGTEEFNLQQLCPTGVSGIQEEMSPGNWFVSCLTCGIYMPISVHIRCASGSAYYLLPDEEKDRTWVYPAESAPLAAPVDQGAG